MGRIGQSAALALACGLLAYAAPVQAQEQALNPAEECSLSTRSTTEIDAVLRQNGVSMVDFLTFCNGLASTRTGIDAAGHAVSHGDKSVALVILRLYDVEGGTAGTETSFAFVEEPGGDEAARTAAYSHAYNLALGQVEQDQTTYIASVVQEMARLDGLYRDGVERAVPPAQQPCAITYRATDPVEQVIQARQALPDFPAYATFCEELRLRGAGLELIGAQLPVDNRTWTMLGIVAYDLATGVQGNLHVYAAESTIDPTAEEPQEDMWTSLETAVVNMAASSSDVFAALDASISRDRAFYPVGQ